MRLFLSSQDLGHHADLAYELCGPGKRAAIIVNAQDYLPEEERAEKVGRKIAMFSEAGFTAEELDLRDYFGKAHDLETYLQNIDLVWGNGGNTFILRRAMQASGLDEILKERLTDDSIMYGGSSAGSCVCAPSLKGIDHGDRPYPDVVPAAYPSKEIIWEGLGLVPFMVVPHCDQEWFNLNADETIKVLQAQKTAYVALNDGEVIIVDGAETRILQPAHESTRYRPISQKPYCCVPTSLQMALEKNGLPKLTQEAIGAQLGLVVPPAYADEFENVQVSEAPVVSSGFGTRIQDPAYSLEHLISEMQWPFALTKHLSSTLANEESLHRLLDSVESKDGDALICYQNDKGYGHVVVFDRIIDGQIRIVDPSPDFDKWREMSVSEVYDRIQKHGDKNMGGLWILERA